MSANTIGTLTNTSSDAWLIKLRNGNVLGTVRATAGDIDAALVLAQPKFARVGVGGALTAVRTAVGVYSIRQA